MSIYARMNIVGIAAILYGTHLTTNLDISTQNTVSSRCCSNVMLLPSKLSIDCCAVSTTYYGVKGSQNARLWPILS